MPFHSPPPKGALSQLSDVDVSNASVGSALTLGEAGKWIPGAAGGGVSRGTPPTLVGQASTLNYHSTELNAPAHEANDVLLAISAGRVANMATSGWYELHTDGTSPNRSSAYWKHGAGGAAGTVTLNADWADHYASTVLALRGDNLSLHLVEHLHGTTTSPVTSTDAAAILYVCTVGEGGGGIGSPFGTTLLGVEANYLGRCAVFMAEPDQSGDVPAYTFGNATHISVLRALTDS